MDMETKFLHDGNPKIYLQTKPWSAKTKPEFLYQSVYDGKFEHKMDPSA